MTIDAYANRLKTDVNKDSLIMEAVLGLYKTPIEERQHEKLKTKNIWDVVKTSSDTINNLTKGTK